MNKILILTAFLFFHITTVFAFSLADIGISQEYEQILKNHNLAIPKYQIKTKNVERRAFKYWSNRA